MAALVAYRSLTLTDNIDDYPEGIILPVDKPYRWTSADVIRKVKYQAIRHFHKKNLKVGHAGTLDPLATGVLLVCIGKATRLAEELQASPKQYLAGVTFGATTPSYDLEKEIDQSFPLDGVSESALRSVLPDFIGEQDQVAPLFSAKSIDGVRAYEMARKAYRDAQRTGSAFDHSATDLLHSSRITIYDLQLESYSFVKNSVTMDESEKSSRIHVADISAYDLPTAMVRVDCSKGTYIRALARDLGEALGSGAFLSSLRRTRNGGIPVEDALSLPDALSLLQ
jgi:tRNA pseudouridine55 synthase